MDIKFRNSESLDEIRSIIKRSEPKNTILWQNAGKKRNVFVCKLINYQDNSQTVKFHLKDYNDTLLVDRTTYIKLSYNQSLFKGVVIGIEKNIVEVQIPTLVKTIDLRQYPREIFLPKDEKKVVIELGRDIADPKKQRLTFNVLDISLNGISIIVSESNLQLMSTMLHQELIALGDDKLSESILMDKKYNQKLRYRLRGRVIVANRFGFKFLQNITDVDLARFSR